MRDRSSGDTEKIDYSLRDDGSSASDWIASDWMRGVESRLFPVSAKLEGRTEIPPEKDKIVRWVFSSYWANFGKNEIGW